MKKVLIAFAALVLILTACSTKQANSQDKAKETYNILITAEKEHRSLTASEDKTVQAFERSLENKDKLGNAIHSMYFNLGVDNKFNQAKKIAIKYLN